MAILAQCVFRASGSGQAAHVPGEARSDHLAAPLGRAGLLRPVDRIRCLTLRGQSGNCSEHARESMKLPYLGAGTAAILWLALSGTHAAAQSSARIPRLPDGK